MTIRSNHVTWKAPALRWRRLVGVGMLSAGLTMALATQPGCEAMNRKKSAGAAAARQSLEEQQMAQLVREHARRLEALRGEPDIAPQEYEEKVIWLDSASLSREQPVAAAQPEPEAPASSQATETPRVMSNEAAATLQGSMAQASSNVGQPAVITESSMANANLLQGMDRGQLVSQLLHDVRSERGDAMARAMNVSMLLGLAGREDFEANDLESLNPSQKSRVLEFHKLAMLLRQQALSPGQATNYQAIMDHLDSLMTEVPLHIRRVELSRSVSSFGVMEPLESRTFLAGRPIPMIVYVELDHFKAIKGDNGRYAVKLAQELVLYNEVDGLAVWREPRAQITDESLNRRRDFFVVQRVELPARLSVGKYLLKVTMTDLQGGSIDEKTIPIQIVADPSLVKKD